MKLLIIIFAAFLVQLTTGEQVMVRDAVGFVQVEIEKIACHGFFDRAGKPILAIPSSLVNGATYLPDDKVM
jgi:hypothetical protein